MPPVAILYSADLQKMSGLSRRHLARLAQSGDIPSAYRHDGYHFAFKDTPALRGWCAQEREKVRMRTSKKKKPPLPPYEYALKTLMWLKKHPEAASGELHLPADMSKDEWKECHAAILVFKHFTPLQIMEAAGAPEEVLKALAKR